MARDTGQDAEIKKRLFGRNEKIKINIIIDIKRLTENNIKWEVNTFAIISPMKGLFVEVEVRDQKGVVFTGKDASELYANKMGA